MRTFDTGATRDTAEGKLDYHEYLSTAVLRRYAQYMLSKQVQPDGEKRPGDNWKKGMPTDAYMASMARHFVDVMMFHEGRFTPDSVAEEGMTLETALCAMLFNVMGYLDNLLIEQENENPFKKPTWLVGKDHAPCMGCGDFVCNIGQARCPACEARKKAEEDARHLKARKVPSPDAELDGELGPVRWPSGEVIEDADGAVTVVPTCPDCGWDLTGTSQAICRGSLGLHVPGVPVGLCDHYMRKHIEKAGGAGQWLCQPGAVTGRVDGYGVGLDSP